jgi:lipoprotein Spr
VANGISPRSVHIPHCFMNVKYDAAMFPGAEGVQGVNNGANCQQFAYEFIRYFGYSIPDFRSSNLWDDSIFTDKVTVLEQFDLVLFNRTSEAWGAHVSVYLDNDRLLHLSKSVGTPVIWSFQEFKNRPEYAVVVGAKRAKRTNSDAPLL